MKRNFLYLCILFIVTVQTGILYASAEARRNSPEQLSKPYVLLVSIDGYRYDYTDKFKPAFLGKFKKTYSGAKGLIPIYPSKTFPNHYTIATGMYAENHGIVANSFYDPDTRKCYAVKNREEVCDGSWYGGVPLWVLAEKQGMLAASYFWVGSEADMQGTYPTYYYRYNAKVPYMERARQVIRWLKMKPEVRPHFITLYFSVVDTMGHEHGPDSEQTKKAVKKVDDVLDWLDKEIKKIDLPVNIIILSDHGMMAIDHTKTQYLDDYVDFKNFHTEVFGTMALIYGPDRRKSEIDSMYETLKKNQKHYRVFKRKDLPEKYHLSRNKRAGDIIVSAKPGAIVTTRRQTDNYGKATHGYAPFESRKMNGIFYCAGPGIRPGIVLDAFENIHVYPLIVELLKLKPPKIKIDGDINVTAPLLKTRDK